MSFRILPPPSLTNIARETQKGEDAIFCGILPRVKSSKHEEAPTVVKLQREIL